MFVLPAGFKRKQSTGAKKPSHPEHSLQERVATYLNKYMLPPAWFTAVGHGGFSLGKTREEAQRRGARMKKAGLKAGVPDILIVFRGRCCWIELKSEKGVVSEAQRAVHTAITLAGGVVVVCRSVEQVIAILEVWGIPMRTENKVAMQLREAVDRLAEDRLL